MGVTNSTYFGFTRVREQSPDARDWAATDGNFELLSRLLKFFETHKHTGVAAIDYPGYVPATPATPVPATITPSTTGGVLAPGTSVGVRLSYVSSLGLETQAAPEVTHELAAGGTRPLTPIWISTQQAAGALPGGTYIYVLTKKKGSGETTISDVLAVDVPFDNTYSVTLQVSAVNAYDDGTTSINLYRSTGLNQAFQLVTNITTGFGSGYNANAVTTFTDTNTIAPQNVNVQPPSSSTFDTQKKIRISWPGITHPAGAAALRVYVTQQTGIWSTNHLLSEIALTGTPATYVDYLGNETLGAGAPQDVTQLPATPAKIDLSTEATQSGTLTFTDTVNFNGNSVNGLKLINSSGPPAGITVSNGLIYYDTALNSVRAYINGAWTVWGTAGTGGANYTHPTEESGGHIANNIRFNAGSSTPTVRTILDRIANGSGLQKQVQTVSRWTLGTGTSTTSTTPVDLSGSSISFTPQFSGQYLDICFNGTFIIGTYGATLTIGVDLNGVLQNQSLMSYTAGTNDFQVGGFTKHLGPASGAGAQTIKIKWYVTSGTVTYVAARGVITVVAVY